jgi:hypothetical protein
MWRIICCADRRVVCIPQEFARKKASRKTGMPIKSLARISALRRWRLFLFLLFLLRRRSRFRLLTRRRLRGPGCRWRRRALLWTLGRRRRSGTRSWLVAIRFRTTRLRTSRFRAILLSRRWMVTSRRFWRAIRGAGRLGWIGWLRRSVTRPLLCRRTICLHWRHRPIRLGLRPICLRIRFRPIVWCHWRGSI